MYRSAIYILLGVFSTAVISFGRPGGAWLEIGPGGRAAGLAETMTASVIGATTNYWNPALVGFKGNCFEVMHANWYDGSVAQFFGGSFQVNSSGLGFSILHVGSGNLDLRDRPSSEPIGAFEARQYALGASISHQFTPLHLRLGGTCRYLSDAIYIYHGSGWSADFGAAIPGLMNGALDLAATIRHLGKMEALNRQAYDLPTTTSLGMYYRLPKFGTVSAGLMADVVQVIEEDVSFRAAMEWQIASLMMLRTGYMSGYEARGLSFGFGIIWKTWQFNYGYTPFLHDLGYTQRISLGVSL